MEKCEKIPMIPLLVDGSDRNGGVMDAIRRIFEPSNHAFIFISGVYEGKKVEREISDDERRKEISPVQMSTPNLMFELGYLYRKMGEERIKLITDLSHHAISNSFCFPSDLIGNYVCFKPELNNADEDKIKSILDEILRREILSIRETDGISERTDLSYNYTPQIESLFAREKSEKINDKSLELQMQLYSKTGSKSFFISRN